VTPRQHPPAGAQLRVAAVELAGIAGDPELHAVLLGLRRRSPGRPQPAAGPPSE
jgi:hypothetical protein